MVVKFGHKEMNNVGNEAHGSPLRLFCARWMVHAMEAHIQNGDYEVKGRETVETRNQGSRKHQRVLAMRKQEKHTQSFSRMQAHHLLHQIHHLFNSGCLLLTPLYPISHLSYLPETCISPAVSLGTGGFHLQIQSEMKLPFQSIRHLFPWKHMVGREGGTKKGQQVLQAWKGPCKYSLVYSVCFPTHNINYTPHRALMVLTGSHYERCQQPGAQ